MYKRQELANATAAVEAPREIAFVAGQPEIRARLPTVGEGVSLAPPGREPDDLAVVAQPRTREGEIERAAQSVCEPPGCGASWQ